MAETIGKAVLSIEIDDRQYQFALDRVKRGSDEAATHIRGIGQAVDLKVFEEFGRRAVSAIGTVVAEIIELGNRGSAVQDVASTFDTLSQAAGSTADAMLGELREGVKGTITDFDLMKLATKTLGSGLVKNSEDMGVLSAGARALAKATGGTTVEAFETLTSAMASGRTAQLKQLGLFVDSKKAIEEYAAAQGLNVSQLTDADRAQALAAASLEALRDRLKLIPPDAADFGEKIDQARTILENFHDALAVAVSQSPVLAAGLDAIGRSFTVAFGTNQQTQVQTVLGIIEDLAIGLTYVAQAGLVGATVFVTAWSGVKTLILGVETALVGMFAALVNVVEGLTNFSAKLPWTTAEARASAAGVTALKESLVAATRSLAEQTAEAARGVVGQSELQQKIDQVAGTIVNVRDAMEEARSKSGEMGAGVAGAMNTISVASDEARARAVENTRAILAAFTQLTRDVALDTKTGNERRLAELEFQKQEEIRKVGELKERSAAEHAALLSLIEAKYAQRVAVVNASVDQIKAKELGLRQEIEIADAVGTEQRLLQIEARKQAELASIAELQVTNATAYNTLAALIREKYAQMSAIAQGHYSSVEQAAAAAGFQTRAQLEEQLRKARQVYADMLRSGLYSIAQLAEAKRRADEAEAELDGRRLSSKQEQQDVFLSSVSSTLGDVFGKSKTAAIAAAIIDVYTSIAKTYATYGWTPWGIAAAVAAAAAGWKQVNAIRGQSAPGFATGTPGLDFASFGHEAVTMLHGEEAVIPRGSGHLLAAEISSAMGGDKESLGALERIEARLDDLPRRLARAVRDGMILGT